MAAPVDVVAGEVIEVEWGNAVRDWAVGLVSFGGIADNTSDATVTTTFEDGATISFTKPSLWVAYTIMAWGSVWGTGASASNTLQARIDIGGTQGTATNGLGLVAGSFLSADTFHSRTGLVATATVKIQYREVAGNVSKDGSTIQYVAIRTS